MATHRKSGTRLYKTWKQMKTRCYNKNRRDYRWYGERGIALCEEWVNDFSAFQAWALSHGYEDGLTIDRIESNGNYEPTNCRFVPQADQKRNSGRCHYLEAFGERKRIGEWAADPRCEITRKNLTWRMSNGWEAERAISTPHWTNITIFGEMKTLTEWSKDSRCEVSYDSLKGRLNRGWSPEDAIQAHGWHQSRTLACRARQNPRVVKIGRKHRPSDLVDVQLAAPPSDE